MTLYRVAQEGFTNIQRHAQATNVVVRLHFGDNEASLHVHDDGVGFDASASLEQHGNHEESYGLRGVQERLLLVGGTLRLESAAGQGTHLAATVRRATEEYTETPSLASETV